MYFFVVIIMHSSSANLQCNGAGQLQVKNLFCYNVIVNEKGVAQSLLHVNHVNHVFEDAKSSRPTLRATRPTFPLVKVSKRYCF